MLFGPRRVFSGLLPVFAAIAGAANANEPGEYRYNWLTVGEPSGSHVVTYADDGSAAFTFEFNDRGRGPETTTHLRLNKAGVPVHIEITGKNYRKGEVDETFSATDGTATWRSKIESGSAAFDGSTFFWANNGAPEMLAVLARALLDAPGQQLEMLPSGRASLDTLSTQEIEADGQSRRIALYGINGLGTSPTYVWLDEARKLFGVDYGWFGLTPEGFEEHIDVLKKGQTDAQDAFYRGMTERLTQPLEGLLAIRGARVFDSLQGRLTPPATVFVWKGKISAVYLEIIDIPEGATVIEAEGKTLMPALWDMHAHVNVNSYFNYLAAGVTNVRDMANDPDTIFKLSDDVTAGLLAGPDVHALGFIDKRGEYSAPTGNLADTQDEAVQLVDYYARRGFHGIKLYSSLEPAWVAPVAAAAHARGMVVMGHVPAYMNATQAINAGYDELTHINMVLLNFMGGETLDTRTPTRFLVPGEKAGELDLASSEVTEFVKLMRDKGIAHDPTLSIFLDMFLNEPGKISLTFRDIADHLPVNVRRGAIASAGFNAGKEEAFARSAQTTRQVVKLLHDNGIRLLPGTDNSLPGFTLIRELMHYADAGIPPAEVLQLATIEPARHLNQQERLGSITVGKDAHLFLVDGNPVEDLSDLYRVEQVVKGRKLYNAPELLRAQGFKPFAAAD
ncbi:MAG: amidohydrolase family protein [Pseudomonadota bacterium]